MTRAIDESVFDAITEESAYWVGFLMADGTIATPKNRNPVVCLGLAEVDYEQVERFRLFLKSSNKVYRYSTNKGTGAVSISVMSARLVKALEKFGLTARKSHTARVIGLENSRHFWRGAIDGDGSIYWGKKGLAGLSFCGSHVMVEQFLSFVRSHVPECRAAVRPNGPIYRTSLLGSYATRIIKVLYSDCSIALARKLERAEAILSLRSTDLKPKVKLEPARKRRRAAGLCIDCERLALPNAARCEEHAERMREQALKSYHKLAAKNRESGACVQCGKSPRASQTLCQKCLDLHNGISRRRRQAGRLLNQTSKLSKTLTQLPFRVSPS